MMYVVCFVVDQIIYVACIVCSAGSMKLEHPRVPRGLLHTGH